ncbi:MAG: hypothetical protein CMJ32_08765 [Phycisphaerae bacterium]|nr:hypothetical protein [Phycisphaerae bacterium]
MSKLIGLGSLEVYQPNTALAATMAAPPVGPVIGIRPRSSIALLGRSRVPLGDTTRIQGTPS